MGGAGGLMVCHAPHTCLLALSTLCPLVRQELLVVDGSLSRSV